MSRLRRLLAKKWSPALLFGRSEADEVADGSITPAKLDRPYIESSFGAAAEGQPLGILRKVIRIWVQDGKVYNESTDEF